MERLKLSKAVLQRLGANPPRKRREYRTDIPGCYLRVGPTSISLSVLKRNHAKKQVRINIPLDPLRPPKLSELKCVIRLAMNQQVSRGTGEHAYRPSLITSGERILEVQRVAPTTEKNYLRCY